jgi:hypothetical protein
LQLVLELLDLHRQRRLANSACVGSVAEMAGVGQSLEITKLSERHHYKPYLYRPQEMQFEIIREGGHIEGQGSGGRLVEAFVALGRSA